MRFWRSRCVGLPRKKTAFFRSSNSVRRATAVSSSRTTPQSFCAPPTKLSSGIAMPRTPRLAKKVKYGSCGLHGVSVVET